MQLNSDPSVCPTSSEMSGRQLSKIETRRLLMDTGLQLFVEKGFVKTHAHEIAARAGVAVGTIYMHFGDKEGLLRAILLQAADDLHARVIQVYQQPHLNAYELARVHIETLVKYIEEMPVAARFVLTYALGHNPAGVDMLERMVQQVQQAIEAGRQQGVYRSDMDPFLAARAEVSMNLGLLAWWAENPEKASREQIIDTLTRFRFSGLHCAVASSGEIKAQEV